MQSEIFIDPGVEIGWCVARTGPLNPLKQRPRSGIVKTHERGDWETRCNNAIKELMLALQEITSNTMVRTVVIEKPQYMQSEGGLRSARSDNLVKLAMMTGRIWQCMNFWYPDADVILPAPSTWKGQRSKTELAERIKATIHPKLLQNLSQNISHDWDAFGLMLWHKGLMR